MTAAETEVPPIPQVLEAREYGVIPVAPGQLLTGDGRLTLRPGVLNHYVRVAFKADRVQLYALGFVGLIQITDEVIVQVRPRFPVRNLTLMVEACGYLPCAIETLRQYQANVPRKEWIDDVLADSFLDAFDRISLYGLLKTYRRQSEDGSFPHGRINVKGSMSRYAARGINHRVEYSWFERTADNPPNRCLKSAALLLHSRYVHAERRSGVRTRLGRIGNVLRALRDVEADPSLDDPQVRGYAALPESRSYYRPALDLAVAILNDSGINLDNDAGSVTLPSLLIKTEALFEDFVRTELTQLLGDEPGLSVLDGNKEPGRLPLYEELDRAELLALPPHQTPRADNPRANPDLVFKLDDGSYPLIADLKYTEVSEYAERSSVEQVIVYAVRYRSPIALTIHPRTAGATKGLHVAGRIGSIVTAHYRVDLGAADLRAEMREMAKTLSLLIRSSDSLNAPA